MNITIASGNSGKLAEFERLFLNAGAQLELTKLEKDAIKEPAETGKTFQKNARIKAIYYSQKIKGLCLADDSGLCVEALEGAPGVRSSRYSGEEATDETNIEQLLKDLAFMEGDFPFRARFVSSLCIAKNGKVLAEAESYLDGEIISEKRGSNGFGYNPIFHIPALNKTMAEASMDEKLELDHRGNAFQELLKTPFLRNLIK